MLHSGNLRRRGDQRFDRDQFRKFENRRFAPIGTPDEMRPRLELWRRQQAALERGEDPTKIEDLIEINAEGPIPLETDP